MPDLKFLPNSGDIDIGLGDAGVETFRDSPFASIARECGQNSADASSERPVKVTFDVFEIPAAELPSYHKYRKAILRCLQKAQISKNQKEIDFFTSARSVIESDKIKILKISDFNTTGLVGPCEKGKPFHSLLKAKGVSTEKGEDSGGSFGIGKNAAFAVSDMQTVFYSTIYLNNEGNKQFLCQGKTILVSHEDDEEKTQNLADGYWGESNFQPVTDSNKVPEWLRRTEVGASLYCIGFRDDSDWTATITATLLQNFFGAVYRGEMEFSINHQNILINKDTIWGLFNSDQYEKAADEAGSIEDFQFSRFLLESLTAVESQENILEIPDLGKVNFRILVREKLPKRVGFVRNGMFITDNLNKFGQKFSRFPLYKEFVALVEPADTATSAVLKAMENPRHDDFSSERLLDPRKRESLNKAMKKLGKEIRDAIKLQTLEASHDNADLNELSEFFADEVDPDKIQDPDAKEENPERPKYKPVKAVLPKSTIRGRQEGEDGGAGRNRGSDGSKPGDGGGQGAGTGGKGQSGGGKTVELLDIRNIRVGSNLYKRKVFFTPVETGPIFLNVVATGINSTEPLLLTSASIGQLRGGSIKMDVRAELRHEIVLDFKEPYDGPIELKCRKAMEVGV